MLQTFKNGQASIVLRTKLLDSTSTTGAGKTGLTSASAGLIISTIADNEATAVAYTQAGSTIEAVTTLGTYAAPTATKCRFKEVDATNHPGVYEFQFADARFAVASAKSLLVSVLGVTGLQQADFVIQLQSDDPYVAKPTNSSLLSIDASGRIDVIKVAGTTQTAGDIPARLPAALVGGRMDSSIGAVAAGAITAAGIADNAIDRATFAADTGLQSIRSNTAQAGGASTITLDAGASAVDSFYNGTAILTTGGTGAGQFRTITGYVGATKVATVDSAWATNPDNTTTFAIFPAGASTTDIATAVLSALNTTTFAEPAQGLPPATASLVTKIGYTYKAWRNRANQTAALYQLYNDDGTTFEKGEVATGP